jgi:hypothetical protein
MTDQTRITPNPDGGVILHLPDVTYIDTQVWSVDVGLTDAGVEALRALLAASSAGQAPATDRAALETAVAVATRLRAEGHDVRAQGADDVADLLRVGERLEGQETPVDRAALRDRIADALAEADGWVFAPGFKEGSLTYQGFLEQADAVLAVLPAPVDLTARLAAALREVLDTFTPMKDTWDGPVACYDGSADIEPEQYERWRTVLDGALRRLADETQSASETCLTNPARPAAETRQDDPRPSSPPA